MPVLNRQEKSIIILLLCIAILGAVIGIIRYDWLKNPEILLSPKNLPNVQVKKAEQLIISNHNQQIKNRDNIEEQSIIVENTDVASTTMNDEIDSIDKSESSEKNVTKNTSGLININIASKEDFMALPYIGEVKAILIIQLRDEMGVFTSIKDLEKVKGIGPKTLAKIEPFITI